MQPNLGHAAPSWSQVLVRIDKRHPGVVFDKLPEIARVVGPVDDQDSISRLGHAGEV